MISLPDILDDVKKLIDAYNPRMEEFRKTLTKEIIEEMAKKFEEEVAVLVSHSPLIKEQANILYHKIDVPTVLVQISSFHYCNDAFRKLTGYSGPIPSPQLLLLEVVLILNASNERWCLLQPGRRHSIISMEYSWMESQTIL